MTPEQAAKLLAHLGYKTSVLDLMPEDSTYLDARLRDDQGLVRVLPAAELEEIDPDHLRLWCHVNAVYLLPSLELVAWLRDKIGGRKAVEVGAGHGAVARALGIPATDSRMQERPEIKAHYAKIDQPVISYPDDVRKMNANLAVRRLKPQVVIGCWVTHIYREDDHERGGNMYGVDERALLEQVECYVHVGCSASHGNKRILDQPHEEHRLPFLFGRGTDCVVYVWEK